MIKSKIFQQFLYWCIWLIIPFLFEVFKNLIGVSLLLLKYLANKSNKMSKLDFFPPITIIIPVYNSAKTLNMCLKSILNQNYPKHLIEILLIDNGSKDNSYNIFLDFHNKHPNLNIKWYCSSQGKSKALNKGIFLSSGKYIINIDSDGWLDRQALFEIVRKFESDDKISCMTGVVLIDPQLIENTKNTFIRILRICELFEYTEAFLVGRNHQSMTNSMYTLAGAFSCFKKNVISKTQMYSFETVGEDTHMTFQIRNSIEGNISICENAFFYVDPIENFNKLYTQRQRWQRGQLEIASLFPHLHIKNLIHIFKSFPLRILIHDHTLALPKLVWFFGMIYLYFINYPLRLLIGANILMYLLYVIVSFLNLFTALIYLKNQKSMKKYLLTKWYICFILPFYRFIVYWIRVAGIINSLSTSSKWHTSTLTEEFNLILNNIKIKFNFLKKLERMINNE
ncbi:TIGR03111 family XrtG-associated glycosyltransferase [Caloranaerobacter sp. DY30410]|uniref:TIGR03111 family XrtG-associated glycosyltransferase n=1 Tax=Caloranaerobacter sp. DY30410 TaxID=3238305 RepID=UPI003D03224E